MKKKNLVTMVAAVSLVSIVGVASTLAYFTDTQSMTNVVTMGNVDITLEEPNFPTTGSVSDIVPNQTIVKDPTITLAANSNDAYVRASVEIKFVDASDSTQTVQIKKDNQDVTDTYLAELIAACEATMDKSDWTKGTDGYYYYNTKLTQDVDSTEAAENVAVLFESVTVPAAWGNEVANARFEINVTAEAVQADNLANGVLQTNVDENEVVTITGWSGITAESYVE